MYQEQTSTTNRACVLSVYTIGFMGAPLAGVLTDAIGPLTTCIVAGAAMLIVVGAVFLRTAVFRVE